MTTPLFRIRPAGPDDYEALCGLWRELDEHHRRARPDLFRVPEGARRDHGWFLEQIHGPESAILVAQSRSGRLAGMALVKVERPPELPVRIVRPHAEVHNLVVAHRFRRQGVAARLMEACSAWARERGLSEIELTVHEFNASALAFYAAAGFETARRRMRLALGREESPC